MEILKRILLIVFPSMFVMLSLWVLSTTTPVFMSPGIIYLVILMFLLQLLVCLRSPNKLVEQVAGFTVSGFLDVLVITDQCGMYDNFVEFCALVIFAYTIFIKSIPNILKFRK